MAWLGEGIEKEGMTKDEETCKFLCFAELHNEEKGRCTHYEYKKAEKKCTVGHVRIWQPLTLS